MFVTVLQLYCQNMAANCSLNQAQLLYTHAVPVPFRKLASRSWGLRGRGRRLRARRTRAGEGGRGFAVSWRRGFRFSEERISAGERVGRAMRGIPACSGMPQSTLVREMVDRALDRARVSR